MKKNAFTLVEIIAVLTVAGILLAILMPVCLDAMPNTKVLKLKKANTTLASVINNLLSNDKFYKGDLGVKFDGTPVDSSSYLCNTMTDVMQVKKSNCKSGISKAAYGSTDTSIDMVNDTNPYEKLDTSCKELASKTGEEIITSDGITYYEAAGVTYGGANSNFYLTNDNYEYYIYKIFCVDIDGIDKGEDPFGYGIRVDGRIVAGKRASEWLKKNNQGK